MYQISVLIHPTVFYLLNGRDGNYGKIGNDENYRKIGKSPIGLIRLILLIKPHFLQIDSNLQSFFKYKFHFASIFLVKLFLCFKYLFYLC